MPYLRTHARPIAGVHWGNWSRTSDSPRWLSA